MIKLEDFPVSPWVGILGESITTPFWTCIMADRPPRSGANWRSIVSLDAHNEKRTSPAASARRGRPEH
jgi:hypothetical protein